MLAAVKSNTDNEEALALIIDVVAASRDYTLTNQVIELLLGDTDGVTRVSRQPFFSLCENILQGSVGRVNIF